jgi:hypothetical protein
MKNKLVLSVFPGILFAVHGVSFFGQIQESPVEVFKDTIFIPKQSVFNKVNSRKILQFELTQNTDKWLYYFESIDKMQIKNALAGNYCTTADFEADSSKKAGKEVSYMTVRKMGPVKLEVLLLENKGMEEFLRVKGDTYVFTRPQDFIINGSSLCEVGDCNSSGKVLIDKKGGGKFFIGFRNIDYTEDAYIIVQIMAMVK